MKFQGSKIESGNSAVVVLPRDKGNIVFTIKSVADYKEFEDTVPLPKAPARTYPDGKKVYDYSDEKYVEAINKRNHLRTSWMLLKGLEGSEIEFETATLSDPLTWDNVETELNTCFSPVEVSLIIQGALQANSLDMEKIEKARQDFLASRALAAETQ